VISSSGRTDSAVIRSSPVRLPPIKKPKPITNEFSVGLRLNSDGWSFMVERGKVKTKDMKNIEKFHDVRSLQFEFAERRSPKELKTYGTDAVSGNTSNQTYVFGKVNNFYALRINYAYYKLLAGKPYTSTVSVHWVNAAGVAIGLLKPYYIDAYVSRNGGASYQQESIKYSPENAFSFLTPQLIIGSSGFAKGLGETKIVPGLHLKTGFHFDFSGNKRLVTAVEVGGTGEFYTQKIELVATQKAVPYFFNLYAGIQFGKRW
jgi:hypothetical protein